MAASSHLVDISKIGGHVVIDIDSSNIKDIVALAEFTTQSLIHQHRETFRAGSVDTVLTRQLYELYHRILDLLVQAEGMRVHVDMPPVIARLHHFITHTGGPLDGAVVPASSRSDDPAVVQSLADISQNDDAPMNTYSGYGQQELELFREWMLYPSVPGLLRVRDGDGGALRVGYRIGQTMTEQAYSRAQSLISGTSNFNNLVPRLRQPQEDVVMSDT